MLDPMVPALTNLHRPMQLLLLRLMLMVVVVLCIFTTAATATIVWLLRWLSRLRWQQLLS